VDIRTRKNIFKVTCHESYPELIINMGVCMVLITSAGKKH
jgi:hypothetical protein